MPLLILGMILVAALVVWVVLRWRRHAHRAAVMTRPFPTEWIAWLEYEVPLYQSAPHAVREALHRKIHLFLEEKRFVGCNGFEVNDRARLIIAAQACLLVAGRPELTLPGFTTILIYPDAFMAETREFDGMVEHVGYEARGGEAWERGPVVLSWQDVIDGTRSLDGDNVVLHEFAHQLDHENPDSDGVPRLASAAQYRRWAQVFSAEYGALEKAVAQGEDTLFDPYGAEAPAEFFAVVTETFFELPGRLRRDHPELYHLLAGYFGLDPASWPPASQ